MRLMLCSGTDWRHIDTNSDPLLLTYCNHLWFDNTGVIHICADYKTHTGEHQCECCESS